MGVNRDGESVGLRPGGFWKLAEFHLWNYLRLSCGASYNRVYMWIKSFQRCKYAIFITELNLYLTKSR